MPARGNVSPKPFGIFLTNNLTLQVQGAGKTGSSTGVCPFCLKRRGIPDGAMDAVKRPGNKGAYHEHFIPAGKRRVDPQWRCRGEPEPGVIGGMPDNDNNPVPQLPAGFEPFLNKDRSNTLALMFQTYGKRCKGNSRYVGTFRFNRYRGKEDMADNLVIIHGHK